MRYAQKHRSAALMRSAAAAALAALVVQAVLGCGAPAPAVKLRIGVYPGEMSAPVAVAQAKGFFESNGLDVTAVECQTGAAAVGSLLAGDIDVATASDYVFASSAFTEPSLRLLTSMDRLETIWFIATAQSGISAVQDLKGRTVGVSPGTLGAYALGSSLNREGLSIKDVIVVDLAPEAMGRALLAGSVEAVVIWDPVAYQLREQMGKEAVSWSALGAQHYHFTAISTDEELKNHPRMSERLMRSLLDAVDFIRENPAEAKRIVSKAYMLGMTYLEYAWPRNYFDIALTQCLLFQLDVEARWYAQSGLAGGAAPPDYQELIDFTGLERADPSAVEIAQ